MKKLILLFFLISTIGLLSFEDIKSLKGIAFKSSGKAKTEAFCRIAEYYYITDNPDSALNYSDLAINYAQQLNLNESKIDGMNRKALVYSFYQPEKFLPYQINIDNEIRKNDYKSGRAYSLAYKALYLIKTDLFQTVTILKKAINLAQEHNDSSLLILCNANLGEAYMKIGNKNEALKHLFSALTLYNNLISDKAQYIDIYNYALAANNLGIFYKKIGDFEKALYYYKIYLTKSIEFDEKWGISIAYNNIGNIYHKLGRTDEALKNYLLASHYFEDKGIHQFDAFLYRNIGNIYWDKKNYDKALFYYEKFDKAAILKNDTATLAQMYLNSAEIYAHFKKYNEARRYYLLAEKTAYSKNKDELINIYLGFSDFYESLKDSRNALFYYKKYSILKDSLSSQSKLEEIGMMTANYEIQKKLDEQSRIDKQNQEIEQSSINRRNLLEYFLLSVLIIFIFSLLLIFGKMKIPETVMEISVFVFILLFFEFLNILTNPYIDKLSQEPVYQLIFNFILALIFSPLDTFFDKYLLKRAKENEHISEKA